MTKWVCTVCGYVYEGDAAPAECPVCHVGADKFKKVEGDLTLAAEHEYGVYAKTVKTIQKSVMKTKNTSSTS